MSLRLWVTAITTLVVSVGMSGNARATLTIEQMMARMRNHTITGATVVTHGYQYSDSGGDSLIELATAVRNRIIADTSQNVWLVDYDIGDDGEIGVFDESLGFFPGAGASGLSGHVVFLYDWAPESNRESRWWAESAGDALFGMMTGMGILNPRYADAPPLQMIAHSFGSGVNSEAVERMAAYKIPVSQMTFIDPHDFDQAGVPVDEHQRIFELGRPTGYGATVWNNVEFADSYYQTRGNQAGLGTAGTLDPEGRPIPGAFNRYLDGADELPSGNPYSNFSQYESDHGYAWDSFYRGTVEGARPTTGDFAGYAPAQPTNYGQTGWAYSVHNPNQIARPDPNFYTGGLPEHQHSSPTLQTSGNPNNAGLATLGITAEQVTNGRWAPDWVPGQIANGTFAAGSHDFVGTSIDIMAGWTHHGGAGGYAREEPFEGSTNFFTRMYSANFSSGDLVRKHNFMYVPLNATALQFDSRIWDGSTADSFRVLMGDTELGTLDISQTDQTWRSRSFAIPAGLRNTVQTITFELTDGSGTNISEVDLDSVRFGMVTPVLGSSLPTGSIIDLGRIRQYENVTLPMALSLSNIGDPGSILDVYGIEYQILYAGNEVGAFDMFFNTPFALTADGPPSWQTASFVSNGARGMFANNIVYTTTAGQRMFRLQVTVVPEPAGLLLLAIGGMLILVQPRAK